ncbi:MAG: rhomboid family intramembrane serine protease [Cyanobacteriota bacterium]
MGQGRDLGEQLRQWLITEPEALRSGRAISNRLIDALGANEQLKAPIRDLAARPLLLQVLHGDRAHQATALASLRQQLAAIYTPAVLNELDDLLAATTGTLLKHQQPQAEKQDQIPTNAASSQAAPAAAAVAEPAAESVLTSRRRRDPTGRLRAVRQQLRSLLADLRHFAPGLSLAGGSALVLWWVAGRLESLLPGATQGGGGLLLALLLLLLQALSLGPLRGIQHLWPLKTDNAIDPAQAWRWPLAPWLHQRHGEGLALGLALLLLMSSAPSGLPLLALRPLDLPTVVLRYCLTALATTSLGVLTARHLGVQKTWSGSSGVVATLVTIAGWDSLIHQHVLHLGTSPLLVPAWVLLLVIGALELHAELPRQSKDNSLPWQRLLASSWGWGTLLGLGVGISNWCLQVIHHLQASGRP